MKENNLSCSRFGVNHTCPVCTSEQLIKSGKTANGKQRYNCKKCNKRFIINYTYNACKPNTNQLIVLFTKEGLGVRSTERVLKISVTTLLKRIISIAKNIKQPPIVKGKIYEVDEMRTFIGKKSLLRWIVYAMDCETKEVVSFNVGRRTNKTLKSVIRSLELSDAKRICTDKLKNYRYLIAKKLHQTLVHSTNHIERHNLSVRTHLKRLGRKTICFSRSSAVLMAVLRIYFWG
ncbi:MAG: IS1 family transposase [Ignavibacteria bacterium]|nr:IS1 family transposase [Ignavibacteria bacterium]